MDLSIIYVNWNSLDYLRESIESVYRYTHSISFEIVVVDNASPEGNVDSLKLEFPEVKVIKSDINVGFAGANNLGFQYTDSEFVLFLNPDTRLVSPSIDVLVARLRTLPDAGIVGCKLLNTDLSVQLSSIQTYPTILNQAVDAEYLRLRWPECRLWKIAPLFDASVDVLKVDVIPGACMLMRRRVFEQVGKFSEDYFMYAEDLDLNFRVKRARFTNYYVGETAIIHHGGRSSARQSVSQWATIMKYRAMLQLFRKTRGAAYAFGYRLAMGLVAIGRLGLLAVLSPLGKSALDRESLRFSFAKWRAVLKWAVGWRDVAVYQ
jgi:GT2 family glycosyltransferase